MEDAIIAIMKGLGISHLNAVLLMVVGYIIYQGFKGLQKELKDSTEKLATVATEVALVKQWTSLHEQEDNKRFNAIHEMIA
jgi:hypothetical protein